MSGMDSIFTRSRPDITTPKTLDLDVPAPLVLARARYGTEEDPSKSGLVDAANAKRAVEIERGARADADSARGSLLTLLGARSLFLVFWHTMFTKILDGAFDTNSADCGDSMSAETVWQTALFGLSFPIGVGLFGTYSSTMRPKPKFSFGVHETGLLLLTVLCGCLTMHAEPITCWLPELNEGVRPHLDPEMNKYVGLCQGIVLALVAALYFISKPVMFCPTPRLQVAPGADTQVYRDKQAEQLRPVFSSFTAAEDRSVLFGTQDAPGGFGSGMYSSQPQ